MDLSQVLKQCQHLAQPYRIHDGDGFKLEQIDPGDTQDLPADKKAAREALEQGVELLSELQQRLYAENKWAVLLVFQAMDAAGKDGTIKHVMSGVNPQGCQVSSFKAPSPWTSITITSGGRTNAYRSAGGLASLTAVITRRPWWFGCTPNSWLSSLCRLSWRGQNSGNSALKTSATTSAI